MEGLSVSICQGLIQCHCSITTFCEKASLLIVGFKRRPLIVACLYKIPIRVRANILIFYFSIKCTSIRQLFQPFATQLQICWITTTCTDIAANAQPILVFVQWFIFATNITNGIGQLLVGRIICTWQWWLQGPTTDCSP